MHTLTIQIKDNKAMKTILDLHQKQALQIVDDVAHDSPALEGKPLSLKEFKNWIESAENSSSVSLKSAKDQWLKKRNRLTRLTK